VVSDVTGQTGMAILRTILRGQRDPLKLAKLRNVNCKRTEAEIARALQGNWRDEHLFALKQTLALYDFYQQQLQECDAQLQTQLGTFTDRREGKPLPSGHGRNGSDPITRRSTCEARCTAWRGWI
jgi:hypothetical protein